MTIGNVVEYLIYIRDHNVEPRSQEEEALAEACNVLDRLRAGDKEAITYEPLKN